MTKWIVVVAVVPTLAVIAAMAYAWEALGDVEISTTGYLALFGGAILALAVGIGLMSLMFYSNRSGWDDRAGIWPEDGAERRPGPGDDADQG
jgi:hypothetical protein